MNLSNVQNDLTFRQIVHTGLGKSRIHAFRDSAKYFCITEALCGIKLPGKPKGARSKGSWNS